MFLLLTARYDETLPFSVMNDLFYVLVHEFSSSLPFNDLSECLLTFTTCSSIWICFLSIMLMMSLDAPSRALQRKYEDDIMKRLVSMC